MTVIDDRTTNRNYPLPNAGNAIADDVGRLRSALTGIDADVDQAIDAAAAAQATANTALSRGLPAGGTTGQVAAKSSNADHAVEWVSLSAANLIVNQVTEKQTAGNVTGGGQRVFTLATLGTLGVAVYVEGAREDNVTVLSGTQVDLNRIVPAGQNVLFVQNDPLGSTGAALQNLSNVSNPDFAAKANSAGVGGMSVRAAVTTATTLTASDANLVALNMSTASQSVTLPAATALLNGKQYTFHNAGTREAGVRNASGQLIARVGAGLTVSVYLRDNSTAAGIWAVEGQDALLPLTILDHTLSGTYATAVQTTVRLTDTVSLHFARNGSGHPFVFAVDHSTYPATVGTPVIIVASSATIDHAFRVSATKAFVMIAGGTNYNVTVSGTTCTVSSSSTAAVLGAATFTGAPLVAALTDTLYVGIDLSGGAVRAQAVDASGTNPSAGSAVNIVASGGQQALGCYRVSDTTALALYIDDSGTAGSPFSIRGVVLSVSGTTVTVGTSAGINDVVASAVLPTVQLTATSYIVSYYQSSGTLIRAAHVGVSGTTVTFGSPLTVETVSLGDQTFTLFNANRFQPNLFRLSDTAALMTYGLASGTTASRHVVITNSGGTLSAGTILYSLWTDANGGNFPQRTDGFLAFRSNVSSGGLPIFGVTVSGTDLVISGNIERGDLIPFDAAVRRFGLSGNYYGIQHQTTVGNNASRHSLWHLLRFRTNAPPQYLGGLNISNIMSTAGAWVELASNRVAVTGDTFAQNGGTTALIKLQILEFPL